MKKRGNARGAKGPCLGHAESEGGSAAWTQVSLRTRRETDQMLQLKTEAVPIGEVCTELIRCMRVPFGEVQGKAG